MSITDHSEPIGFDIILPLVCVSCCVYVRGCHCVYLYKHMNKNIPNEKEILNKEESNILFSLTTLLFSLSRSFHQMNEIIPLRQGGDLVLISIG